MIDGVLFLTAGFGTRAEPLSVSLPKCLFPLGGRTLLGRLIDQFKPLCPKAMVFNASRCPEMIMQEAGRHWAGKTELLFEERPLGAPGTLARNHELLTGTWLVCNTDFSMKIPVKELVETHFRAGSSWTVLTGDMPEDGHYGPLELNGYRRHYLGVSVVSGLVPSIAFEEQIATGFFTELRHSAERQGIVIHEHFTNEEWLDMGETELFRRHSLSKGSFIDPTASVEAGAMLQGFYSVGEHCIIHAGALVRNSVLLPFSEILPGGSVIDTVLPAHSIKES